MSLEISPKIEKSQKELWLELQEALAAEYEKNHLRLQAEAEGMNLDVQDLLELMTETTPEQGIEDFLAANPGTDLQALDKVEPYQLAVKILLTFAGST